MKNTKSPKYENYEKFYEALIVNEASENPKEKSSQIISRCEVHTLTIKAMKALRYYEVTKGTGYKLHLPYMPANDITDIIIAKIKELKTEYLNEKQRKEQAVVSLKEDLKKANLEIEHLKTLIPSNPSDSGQTRLFNLVEPTNVPIIRLKGYDIYQDENKELFTIVKGKEKVESLLSM